MHLFNKSILNFKLGKYLTESNIAYIIFSPDYVPLFWSPEAERLLPDYKNTITGLFKNSAVGRGLY